MRFRKKPVIIEAIQWTGSNFEEIKAFYPDAYFIHPEASRDGTRCVYIRTLEGDMWAAVNDWIIKGIKGEFHPCKPDISNKPMKPS